MVGDLVIFVSKRLQRPAAALLCLMAAQLVLALAGGQPAPTAPTAARAAISR
jgi:hypothetical protein